MTSVHAYIYIYKQYNFFNPCTLIYPLSRVEFAYQLLLCIPISKTLNVVDRLSPLLHRDFISVSDICIYIYVYIYTYISLPIYIKPPLSHYLRKK